MTGQTEQSKPGSKRKRLVLSAGAGVALGIACRLVPEPWQIPCTVAVKLAALIFGVHP